MGSHRFRIAAVVAALAVLTGVWITLAPVQLGGTTTFAITDGISMKPLLHAGDLALIRVEPSYHVGEVVLYENQVLHRPVLHRIYLIQNGNYFFKGDNNGFVDPGYATRGELVGKLWFFIPSVGSALAWVATPLHAGLLAGGVALVVALVGAGAPAGGRRRRRRGTGPVSGRGSSAMIRRRDGAVPAAGERRSAPTGPTQDGAGDGTPPRIRERRSGIQMTPDQVAGRHAPGFLEGPLWSLMVIAVSAVLAVVLLGVGLSRPSDRWTPLAGAYRQAGAFSYSAPVKAVTPVYPTGAVSTGQPIYPSLVDAVTVQFTYRFASSLVHHITGTVAVRALILSQENTWQESSTVKAAVAFRGDRATTAVTLPLSTLYALTTSVSTQSGAAGAAYSVDIQPVIHFAGTVGGRAVHGAFDPVLPFSVATSVVTLDVADTPAPPGATYVAPTASSQLAATLNPVQAGSVPHLVDNVVTVARYQIPVGTVVLLGSLVGALAAVMAVVHDRARRRRTLRTDEELTARRLHALIVPVVSLDDSDGSQLIEIPDFPHLAELAQFLQRPILYALRDDRATYAVDDETVRYRYRPGGQSSPGHPASNRGHKPPGPGHGRRWSLPAKGGAALFVVGALITVSSVFTLSTTVPSSYAGTSNQALQISQLAPVGCSSLALTSLVQGSGVFSNTVSKALVLGSAGADTITDSGTGNCIVGGGGTNTITGTASDICISGPTLAVAAPCPTATPTTTTTTTRPVNPSNGLTATPASDNYNNYGGQERLTLTNTYAITAMTVTINVAQTAGVNFNSQSNSFPGGALTQTSTVAGGVITYSWVLAAGTTIPAGYNGVLYAQFGGSGSAHAMSGDTWTVTSTSNGISSNLTGTF